MAPSSVGMPTNRSTFSDSPLFEPHVLAGQPIVGRLYRTQKAMWKLGWFLRDFLYDPELLAHEQVDEKALRDLRGVVKVSHTVINRISLINLEVHHRQFRSHSGHDSEENLITLCTV